MYIKTRSTAESYNLHTGCPVRKCSKRHCNILLLVPDDLPFAKKKLRKSVLIKLVLN